MQQPSHTIELPQFTGVSDFALDLAKACISWRAPRSGEDFFSYFARTPRQRGDELGLRATLIRELILPVFNYTSAQIEYESQERFDLTLWNHSQQERRRIAIIETKSSDEERNIISIKEAKGLPPELTQLSIGQQGFDYLVGNPPYVSAGESSDNLLYRNVV